MFKNFFSILSVFMCYVSLKGQDVAVSWPEDFQEAPKLAWECKTKGPVFSSPVVDDHIVYFGSLDSNLYAVDINYGKVLWKYKTSGDIRSTVTVDGKSLLIVSGDGCLYSIDKSSQQLNWKFQGRGDRKYELFTFADYFQSSPVVHGDTAFYGSGDSYVYAVNTKTGKLYWEYKTDGVIHATPLLYRNKIFIGSFDGYFYALDSKNGQLIWKFKSIGQRYFPKGEMSGSAIAYYGMIITGGRDYNLYALSSEKGNGVWNRQFPGGWAIAKPVVRDTVLYIGTSDDRAVFALDPFEGRVLWKTDVKFNVFGSYAFSKTMLYVPTLMGRIYAINLKDGSVAWQMNNKLFEKNKGNYFTTEENYRNDIQNIVTGEDGFLKMYYSLGAIFSTPLIAEKYLLITSTDGSLYAYKK